VDLIRAYSNRRDLADALVSTVQQLRQAQTQSNGTAYSVRSTPLSTRQWRVGDRMSEAEIEQLVAAFTAGTSKRKLAERYGISESSVKRLVRQHGASKPSSRLCQPSIRGPCSSSAGNSKGLTGHIYPAGAFGSEPSSCPAVAVVFCPCHGQPESLSASAVI
jgi:hypothetical protein